MKIFKLYFIVVLLFLIHTGCEKSLDLRPISEMTTKNAYITASDAEAALVGAYNSFYAEYYIWDNVLLGDVRSDNAYAGSLDDVNIVEYENLKISSNNTRIFSNWSSLYNGIARCNIVISKTPAIEDLALTESRKQQIVGEASLIRAFHYFNLVKMFGGVPIVTLLESADPDQINIARSTEIQVYDLIVKDIEKAIALLPYKHSPIDNALNKSRASKGAAYALMAKVWAQRPDRDYNKVLEYCDSVITSPANYQLLTNYGQLFDGSHYSNSESILEIQFKSGTPQGNWGPQLFLPPSISGDSWRKYGAPSKELVALFRSEKDVIRENASIKWERVSWADEHWSPNAKDLVPFIFKMQHAAAWASGDAEYLLRLADILLLKAEAQFYTNKVDKGRAILNIIRKRVNLPATTAEDADLLEAILLERQLELAFEAHRWDDLVRNKKAIDVMNNIVIKDLILKKDVTYSIGNSDLLLPIPANEMDRNPNLVQNP